MTNLPPPITHALFDMDGLLLDTETIYTQVTQKIVSRFGKQYDWSIKANMIGRKAIDSARYLVEVLALPITAEEYLEEREDMLKEGFKTAEALPGAERLIRHLNQHQIPIALATSSMRNLYEVKATNHQDWFRLFDAIVTVDDPEVNEGKPAPDLFNVAAKRIGADPTTTLVFEDAPSGLAAASAANMRAVVVPDPNMDRTRYADADLILDSLMDFDPSRYGIPAF